MFETNPSAVSRFSEETMKEIEKENARHRWATSDLTLDNQILSEVVQGAVEGRGRSALKRYP